MVSKCANPGCSATFRYLHDGKVFRVEFDTRGNARKPEYFWLCGDCASLMTIATDAQGITLVSLPKSPSRAMAAAAKANAA
ncbi:MAG: hypothetical protein JO041_12840 [Acidobacteria bacterium]|nr:hypothetical protein [Acidobacteriota bacterium]